MKKVSMARLRDIIRTATLFLIAGLVLSIGFVLVYVGVVMSLIDYIEHGGGYPPFVLAEQISSWLAKSWQERLPLAIS